MAVEAQRLPVEALADAAGQVAATGDLRTALAAIASAAADALAAELVVLRVLDPDGDLVARAVAPEASALGAEAAGTRVSCERIEAGTPSEPVQRASPRAHVLVEPARAGGRIVGSVEVVRVEAIGDVERALASLVAAQVAMAVRTLSSGSSIRRAAWLDLAGEALAAGGDARRVAQQAVRIAVDATGARGGVVWRVGGAVPERVASVGEIETLLPRAAAVLGETIEVWRPASVERDPVLGNVATLPLGQPSFAALQLFYGEETVPADSDLPVLAAFAARAAHALRTGERARSVELELERTRALLEVVSEAIARLSLAHTLETAVDRIAELLQVDQVGVYLRDEGRLFAAAGRGVSATDHDVAERVAEAFAGPLRARASVHARRGGSEPALAPVRTALAATGQRSVVGVPLHVREESIGLLLAYPGERELAESDLALLAALAAQLAVAVQNARLHERATELGTALYEVLDSERKASRQVNALYEISRSFAQTLSLDSTLAAVTETLVREFHVDAAVIRVPDERGDQFVPRAVRVAESRLADAVRTILERPQPRPPRSHAPVMLDLAAVARLGGAHALLRPFLEKGSTAALIPIATTTELLAELTIVSLDPADPITDETLATARTIAQQAALAIDNARLYQQQKQFAETMQQSLLPREKPAVAGLDVGRVYESAAQVDVGGDVYDFLELADGRLAVVLGDVTGHGIDATADMAMAKFVFRSLAREHPEPSEFLAYANEVVVGEIAVGKFITMAYITVDPGGDVLCASAGHPEPRLVRPGGGVDALACGGLALGILAPQEYEQVRAELEPGAAVVLYTDGVIESRRERELFGAARLDEVLAQNADRPAQEIADAVLAACRGFAGGDLPDDCAIVVIKRT
ncbi:MAG TPA: GAF domain-containing SpoIIE family protein phosphatase [Gaiellaceae bacterium]